MSNPITVLGHTKLRTELEERKSQRVKISQSIAIARQHGDLSENAEYHAAREQQGLNEARIRQIESILSDAQIIDITKIAPNGRVIFGSTVHIMDLQKSTTTVYRLTGEDEANPKQGTISVKAPFARAMIGKSKGEIVTVHTPTEVNKYKITKIEHI